MNIVPFNPAVSRATQGLIPATLSEALKFADVMAGAKLVPEALQKSPSDCLMVIQQAVRWQMDPFAVAQECSVIQGKLMYSGKLVAAVINVRGDLEERLWFVYEGEGDNRTITVSGRRRGEDKARTATVALKNARTSNTQWSRQPDQQLMYHGTRVWARRHMPELMLGVFSPEEFDEAVARGNARIEQLAPVNPPAVPAVPPHDPETGEIRPEAATPYAIAVPKADTQWRQYVQWGSRYIAAIGGRDGQRNRQMAKTQRRHAGRYQEQRGENLRRIVPHIRRRQKLAGAWGQEQVFSRNKQAKPVNLLTTRTTYGENEYVTRKDHPVRWTIASFNRRFRLRRQRRRHILAK